MYLHKGCQIYTHCTEFKITRIISSPSTSTWQLQAGLQIWQSFYLIPVLLVFNLMFSVLHSALNSEPHNPKNCEIHIENPISQEAVYRCYWRMTPPLCQICSKPINANGNLAVFSSPYDHIKSKLVKQLCFHVI